jgi:2-aminoadipate transaminase
MPLLASTLGSGRDRVNTSYRPPMAVTPESRRWEELFAARTRNDAGDGIAVILGYVSRPDLISFAGGFPDPLTFPAEQTATILQDLASAGDVAAFQYAPTRGLAGTRDAMSSRIEALQGARPADDELLVTSGGIEALELVSKSFLDKGDTVVVEGPTYLGAIMAFRGF